MNKLRCEIVDQLQWGERQRRGAVTLLLWQPIDYAFGVEQFQPLKRERRASTIAQQPLQAGAILCAHAHRGIQREAAVRLGGARKARISRTSSGSIRPLRANRCRPRTRT